MDRSNIFKSVLWMITGLGLAAFITRFLFGLGAVANMSDAIPWGFWKGFNVFPGIALAGGGFVMTAIIYVMHREEYHRYAKVSVLLALLGYLTAATALFTELGLPWMIWHPVIYWQHHSALFEVSWCVMLYLTVLFLEFLPVPLEETSMFAGVRRFLTKYKLALVFLGIMISTLHQSSLGTMWLIAPSKLHPLWYTPLLPILFFISAVGVGPLMLILGVLVISYVYRKNIDHDILTKLALLALSVVAIFGLVRFVDIGARGKLPLIFDGSWQASMFIIEIGLMVIIPIVFLGIKKLRHSQAGLWIAAMSAVIGLVLNRANIAGIVVAAPNPVYTPTLFEVLISLFIISSAILAFLYGIERFKIWDQKWESPHEKPESKPVFNRTSEVWLGTPRLTSRTVYSLIFVFGLAIGFAIIPSHRIYSGGITDVPAMKARGGDTLFVDGNHDDYGVTFRHDLHIARNGEKESCVLCHHMNMPKDEQSGCYDCHQDMYQPTDAFRHDWHASPYDGNITCNECHDSNFERMASNVKDCAQCHNDLFPQNAAIKVEQYLAPSYTDAMHDLCVKCHKQKAIELADKPDLTLCSTCHKPYLKDYMQAGIKNKFTHPYYNHVALPGKAAEKNEIKGH